MFLFVIIFLIVQRLCELLWSKRNERWLKEHGAIEYGRNHYPWIVILHTVFIGSLILEYLLITPGTILQTATGTAHSAPPSLFLFFLWVCLIGLKVWVILSLGYYWNTRIYRIPGSVLVKKGLYKYITHPNYIIVILEIALIPLVFHLYYTAVLFTILNAFMLRVRIQEENKAWRIGS